MLSNRSEYQRWVQSFALEAFERLNYFTLITLKCAPSTVDDVSNVNLQARVAAEFDQGMAEIHLERSVVELPTVQSPCDLFLRDVMCRTGDGYLG